jgi:hypothetical protein
MTTEKTERRIIMQRKQELKQSNQKTFFVYDGDSGYSNRYADDPTGPAHCRRQRRPLRSEGIGQGKFEWKIWGAHLNYSLFTSGLAL